MPTLQKPGARRLVVTTNDVKVEQNEALGKNLTLCRPRHKGGILEGRAAEGEVYRRMLRIQIY